MTRITPLRIVRVAVVCLLPLPALAQSDSGFDIGEKPEAAALAPPPTNWVTIGSQYQSDGSYYLGRFSGAVAPGFYGLGDFHLGQRDAWDSGGTNYWDVQGANLGFWDRSFSARAGQQGTWGLTFSYDGIPYEATNNFHSVWTNNGTTVPGVPPGSISLLYPATPFVPGVGAVNSLWLPVPSPTLAARLFNYNIGTRRDVFTGTGKYQWGDWTITGAIRHEHKTGYQANSAEIGGTVALTTAGTGGSRNIPPAASVGVTSGLGYFAMPIDYDTDRYEVLAAYGDEKLQVQLGYTFSNFKDNMTQFNLQNPFNLNPTTTFGTSAANLYIPYSLPPSNSAHQVKALVGYNISPTMRFNANFAYGVELQNDSFPIGSGDPVNIQHEPSSSFDGLVQTLFGNAALTYQPIPKLDLRLSYSIDNRDNQSPRNGYQVDTRSNTSNNANNDCNLLGTGLCFNAPYSYKHQTITAEASYRILPQTKFLLNDTFEIVNRTFADTSLVTSNKITAKLRSQLFDDVFSSVSYSHQNRTAHNYDNGISQELISGTAYEPNPQGFFMFFEASRRHDEVKGTIDASPTNDLTGSLMVKYAKDVYPEGTYGLRNNHNLSVGPDISWQITPSLSAHAYYTYQQIFYDQSSIYISWCYTFPWNAQTTDSVNTFGAKVDWQAIPNVLKFTFDYNLSSGDTAYAFGDSVFPALGSVATTSPTLVPSLVWKPLPDVKSTLNVVTLRGEYTFRPDMTVLFGYAFERFTYKDFMYFAGATQYANALLPGTVVPNDSVHVIYGALRFRF